MRADLNEDALCFGTMRLYRQARLLLDGGRQVRLGGRALDLLVALVERAPAVVSKAELEARVWPHGAIDGTSLRVQVGTLRKCLGEREGHRYVANVPGRGYSFVAPVWREAGGTGPPRRAAAACALPVRLASVVGRDEAVAKLAGWLGAERLVTVVGAGGVGKSTVAVAAATAFARQHGHVVPIHIDFATATPDPCAWPALEERHALLVLESCELQVEEAARRVVGLLQATPHLRVLATSREPLRVEGERVFRLGPLAVPPAEPLPARAEAGDWPALALLADRLRAQTGDFELDAEHLPAAVALCRRLEGLPLAIELAAAQVTFFGLKGLLQRLEGGWGCLTSRDRTGPERQRSWRDSAASSWATLPAAARRSLARLSVFPGAFDAEEATAVAAVPAGARAGEVLDHVADGVAKCLLVTVAGGEVLRYRFAAGLREHAGAALVAEGDAEDAQARWVRLRLAAWRQAGCGRDGATERLAELEAMLAWACSPGGDPVAGAQAVLLASAAALQLHEPSRFAVCVGRVLQCMGGEPGRADAGAPRWRARLEVLAAVLQRAGVGGPDLPSAGADVAEAIQRLQRASPDDPSPAAGRLASGAAAEALFLEGRFDEALASAQQALDLPADPWQPDVLDVPAATAALRARILWLQGQAGPALEVLQDAVARAAAAGAVDLCRTLAEAACPIALWSGDPVRAQDAIERLRACAARHGLPHWQRRAAWFDALLAARLPQPAAGTPDLADLATTFQPALVSPAQAERARSGPPLWCAPELLRAAGEAALAGPDPERVARARACFSRAAELAHRQGSLAWELRAALSAARLDLAQGAAAAGLDSLAQVLARMPEDGADTADRLMARALLAPARRAQGAASRPPRVRPAAPRHESSR
ncbi:winged helix-turn-helix domain-containing protein [Rubrivivax sp. RP6-9]|uniref:winged helix-turn-helix domain-containing protein n=1 Tax=Rubrivivax sp. RP6-9 TaxID=3415750 RepID=UPI003CC53CD9